MKKKITAIVQARIGSERLRAKVIKKINGKAIILLLLKRLSLAKEVDDIIIAIPNKKQDDVLYNILKKNNFKVFRGSEKNVLNRYYECAKRYSVQNILRITADCPLLDPKLIDKLIKIYKKNNFDYVSNIEKRTFPDGMDIEIFNFKSLHNANLNLNTEYDKEHVTKYFLRTNRLKKFNYCDKHDYSKLRLTLDTLADFDLIKKI